MHEREDEETSAERSEATPSLPSPSRVPMSTPAAVLWLQRSAGNRAVADALASSRSHGAAGGVLQRMGLYPYSGASKLGDDQQKDMEKVGQLVTTAVEQAVATIRADPKLQGQNATQGYLGRWVKTYEEFLRDPRTLPPFFFARYGYAVETIAVGLLKASPIPPYVFRFQISHGHTRPDVVVTDSRGNEIAWIDITSEGSPDHILRKQHSGWKSRPYVAEVRYDVPIPLALATSQPLDPKTLEALKNAAAKAAREDDALVAATEALAPAIRGALTASEKALTKGRTQQIVRSAIREAVGEEVSPIVAKTILRLLETFELEGRSGADWANWAFKNIGVNTNDAKAVLIAYGEHLLQTEGAAAKSADDGGTGDTSVSSMDTGGDGGDPANAGSDQSMEI